MTYPSPGNAATAGTDEPVTVESELVEAVEAMAPWICRLARVGYASKGIVYVVIGALAALAAFGLGGGTTDMRGVLTWILVLPFGRTIIATSVVGLLGYAIWRLVGAWRDTEHRGKSRKGIALRLGQAGSGGIAIGLAAQAWRVLTGEFGDAGDVERWTTRIMMAPAGRWMVGLIGLAVVAYALFQFYKAIKSDVTKHLHLWSVDEVWEARFEKIARFGLAARGLVFFLIGWFLAGAALKFSDESAHGIESALDAVADFRYGAVALSVVSFGLVSYGLMQLINARWRRVEVD